jgi:hypothetical protein
VCSFPVNANGGWQSGVTGEPPLAPQMRLPGLNKSSLVLPEVDIANQLAVDVELGSTRAER